MRPNDDAARPTRSLGDILAEALDLLRQDPTEYATLALGGGFAAAVIAIVLTTIGGPVAAALIAPAALLIAMVVFGSCAAAARRVEEHMDPDAGRSFAMALVRLPWVLGPALPACALSGLAIGGAVFVSEWTGRWLATAFAALPVLYSGRWIVARSLPVAAVFVRDVTPSEAAASGLELARRAPSAVLMTWIIALAPWALIAAGGAIGGYGLLATTLCVFVFVVSMPLPGAMLTILYATAVTRVVLMEAPATRGRTTGLPASAVQQRLTRMR